MEEDERLVEFRGVATPWKDVPESYEVFGGKVFPRCWGFSNNGELLPTEFGFSSGSEEHVDPEPHFDPGFLREFHQILVSNGLEKLLGLTVFDSDSLQGNRMVERTVGRVSLTLPLKEPGWNDSAGMESAWTFGCHESMDDSNLIVGRICWVCDACK